MAVQKLIGQTILSFGTLASTNDKLRSLINEGDLPNGAVVDCGQQMDGRGQRGNVWLSEANQNIHLSILFQPNDLFVQKQFLISKAVALGIRSTINEVLQFSDAIIKWPNDILIAGDKVAGVLIENIIQGNKIGQSIIGIGLNVNQTAFGKFERSATSLALLDQKKFDLAIIKSVLFGYLDYYLGLMINDAEYLNRLYLNHLFGITSKVGIQVGETKSEVLVDEVRENGEIQFHDGNKVIGPFNFQEVKFI